MDVSKNSSTPKSSISIGFSIINHPLWGTPIFGNTQMDIRHTKTDPAYDSNFIIHEHFSGGPEKHVLFGPEKVVEGGSGVFQAQGS